MTSPATSLLKYNHPILISKTTGRKSPSVSTINNHTRVCLMLCHLAKITTFWGLQWCQTVKSRKWPLKVYIQAECKHILAHTMWSYLVQLLAHEVTWQTNADTWAHSSNWSIVCNITVEFLYYCKLTEKALLNI